MEQITVSNIKIDVVRKKIKNIHLAVYPPTGRVRIAAPLRVTDDTLRLFAISKLSWIKRRQKAFEGQERASRREFKQRESHYFQGTRYLLKVVEAEMEPKVVLNGKKYLELHVRPETTPDKRQTILNAWYRTELKKEIPAIIAKWEGILNVKVADWQIRQMKTKWGSCNVEQRRIWLNLELAKKPIQCLEYIIVHEMVHLLERHHNERYLFFLDKYLPNWKQLRTELNNLPVSHVDWLY